MADFPSRSALPQDLQDSDDRLSQRFIALDPAGYFLIRLDREASELVVEHFSNNVNERGLATDPETGEVLACRGGVCLLYTSPSPRDRQKSRMPSSA